MGNIDFENTKTHNMRFKISFKESGSDNGVVLDKDILLFSIQYLVH